ncbi:probable E3 SUMO-protein ligase RNF212 isoform X2 [Eublepharis macularius]|uniref:Probable E3 SUMO-protein ligase RNF212 isoform X2 n=1 Tax=Eublepharis macularius TaxID=481883 RepID=A0AA97KT45_EUBMA|nr:probable E3 SUMO-protein ligase RNF212 isoform X2 [Eublepharis macularius]
MAAPPFCNGCFQRPRGAAPELRLTSCGHLLCPRCLPSGQKELCVICRIPCRTIMLSKKISQFQEKHRGHLLTYYRGKIAKLEGYWKAAQQMQYIQHQQHLKPRQEGNQVPSSISVKTSVSKKQNDNAAYFLCSTPLSTSEIRDPSMELDCVSPSVRKVETVAGPARLSVISPPQNGQMGSVSCRSSCFSGMALCQNSTSEREETSVLKDSPWLPICFLTFKDLNDSRPGYLKDPLLPYCPAFQLRSASSARLSILPLSGVREVAISDRASSVMAPHLSSDLPLETHLALTILSFRLKHLFLPRLFTKGLYQTRFSP